MRGLGHGKASSKPTLEAFMTGRPGGVWAVATGRKDHHWSSACWEALCPGPITGRWVISSFLLT